MKKFWNWHNMLIADENIDTRIINAIKEVTSDIISIRELYSGISDEDVIRLSISPPRIILTEDKDFGEWVFAHHIKNISVILLRYRHKELHEIIAILKSLLINHIDELFGKFTTVTIKKVRIRQIL